MLKNRKTYYILFILLVFVSFYMVYHFYTHSIAVSCSRKYEFIRGDLNCDKDPQEHTKNMNKEVSSMVQSLLKNGKVDKISVFYRNLDNLQWFGVNENEDYDPASLFKLPLAIAYYKVADVDPGILLQQYEYKSSKNDLYKYQYIKPSSEVRDNNIYSVEELINRMIRYSDNEVVPILSGTIGSGFLNKVYSDLDVKIPVSGINQDFVSAKRYSSILRILYNSSYLNQYYSNHLLEIMSQSEFKDGIRSGIPNKIKVANKFGERFVVEEGTNNLIGAYLHDCGIVYAEKNGDYIICIMTQGKKFEELPKVISDISRLVYNSHSEI